MHKIMLIDDDSRVGEVYGGHLEKEGYRVVVRKDATDTVAAIGRFQPQLILLDVELGTANGIQILQEIRQIQGLEGLPVILFTSHASPEVIRLGWEAGASRVVSKLDCDPEQMLVLVRAVLDGKTPAWKASSSPSQDRPTTSKSPLPLSSRPLRHLPGLIKAIQSSDHQHTRQELLNKASQLLKDSLHHGAHGSENLKSLTRLFLERLEEVVPDPEKNKGFLWKTLLEGAEVLDQAWASTRGTFPRDIALLEGDIIQSKAIALACMKAGLELQSWSRPAECASSLKALTRPPVVFIFGLKHGLENPMSWRKQYIPGPTRCVLLLPSEQVGPKGEEWVIQKVPFNLKETGLRLANLATRHWINTP